MFKLDAIKCFIISMVCVGLFVLFVMFEWFFLSMLALLIAFGFLTISIYKYRKEIILTAYDEFSDMSMFVIGMTKDDVRRLNSYYSEQRIEMSNEPTNGICETCGGKVVDGVCLYCGNKYDDTTKVTSLIYSTAYGQRTFTFKGNKLTNTKIWLRPLEDFL